MTGERFYQICFTRMDQGVGWTTFNASPDIPQSMLADFSRMEAGNEIKGKVPVGRDGTPLHMREWACARDYFYAVMVEYGHKDEHGRSSFFSHGYGFENAYELLKDPSRVWRRKIILSTRRVPGASRKNSK